MRVHLRTRVPLSALTVLQELTHGPPEPLSGGLDRVVAKAMEARVGFEPFCRKLIGVYVTLETRAGVAELADAPDSKSGGRKAVKVRFLSPAPVVPSPTRAPYTGHSSSTRLSNVWNACGPGGPSNPLFGPSVFAWSRTPLLQRS